MGVGAKDRAVQRIVVAGGAGFIGSHLCEALLARGDEVICLDNFLSGSPDNIARFAANPRFSLVERGVCDGFEPGRRVDRIFNLVSAGSLGRDDADPTCNADRGRRNPHAA